MLTFDELHHADATAFVAGAEERGWVHESEIETLATRLELADAEVSALRDELDRREVDVRDDLGRPAPATTYANGDLVHYTADAMSQFLAEAARHPLLTGAEELELARRIERGDLAAKDRLIASNLRLVVSIAKRYPRSPDMPLIDLVQEGTLGLIRAAEKFDWRKGFKFSTYATLWIKQAIGRGLAMKSRAIRLPHEVEQHERKIAAARHALQVQHGREPTPEEIAARTNLTVEDVTSISAAPRVVTSLDLPVGEDESMPMQALIPSDDPEVGEEVHIALGQEAVRRAVADMPEPQRSIIKLRYGLDGDPEPKTYTAIARQLRMKPERVRRLEEEALAGLALRRELAALSEAA